MRNFNRCDLKCFPEIYLLTYIDSANVSMPSNANCKQYSKMPANKISISTNLMTVPLLSIFNLILSSQDNSPVRDNIRKIIGKLIDIYYIS